MNGQDFKQLTLFLEGSPVSHLVLPGSEEARQMTATSGRKCSELYRKSVPVGWLVKTLLESSVWNSTRCYLTWKESATPQKHWFFRLAPSMPHTEGTGCALLPTITKFDAQCGDLKGKEYREGSRHAMKLIQAVKLWPTPSASDCGRTAINPFVTSNGTIRHRRKDGGQSYARLDAVAAMYATPTARSWKTSYDHPKRQGTEDLQSQIGGQLNPDWVEWMMGFPCGWTEV